MSIEIRNHVRRLHVAVASRFLELSAEDEAINEASIKFNDMVSDVLAENNMSLDVRNIDEAIAEINKAAPAAKIEMINKAIGLLN